MEPYRRHRFPPTLIQHAIWMYLRFTLSYRDVEEVLAQRGLDISYETVRRWVLKFGPLILQHRQTIVISLRQPMVDRQIPSLHIASFAQRASEGSGDGEA